MMNLFAYEFARLRRRRFAGALVGTGTLKRFLLRHTFLHAVTTRNAAAMRREGDELVRLEAKANRQ
jgi:hypothetical protein